MQLRKAISIINSNSLLFSFVISYMFIEKTGLLPPLNTSIGNLKVFENSISTSFIKINRKNSAFLSSNLKCSFMSISILHSVVEWPFGLVVIDLLLGFSIKFDISHLPNNFKSFFLLRK